MVLSLPECHMVGRVAFPAWVCSPLHLWFMVVCPLTCGGSVLTTLYWTLPTVLALCDAACPVAGNEPGACFYSGVQKEAAALLCVAELLGVRH